VTDEPAVILHLMPEDVLRALPADGVYEPASLAIEGFVHCTGDDELMLRVANAFYTSEPGSMVVLSIDASLLSSEVKWEAPVHGDPLAIERFPHVYGPLEMSAVVGVRRLVRDAAGRYLGYEPEEN
jgi:uncharacterized protein (DUF952 family)